MKSVLGLGPKACIISFLLTYRGRVIHFCINTLRRQQNGHHFPDYISIWIFLNENVRISINISLKFVPRGPINNIPTLGQLMAWRRPGDKPLSEPMMVRLQTLICIARPQRVNTLVHHCLRLCHIICSFPSHYLSQCWHIVNWTLCNKLRSNFDTNIQFSDRNMKLKISEKWHPCCLSLNVLLRG